MVRIDGADNFVYPLDATIPTIESITLICTTDMPSPTYQWEIYDATVGAWVPIVGKTTNTLSLLYGDVYFAQDEDRRFRCTVNESRSAMTLVRVIRMEKSEQSTYLGIRTSFNISGAKAGDILLYDGMSSELVPPTYGNTYRYDGVMWG